MKNSLPLLAVFFVAGCQVQSGDSVVFTARQGKFVHELSSRGDVFSQGGTEIRCEVDGSSPDGTVILEIIAEGASVQPGDRLVQLDVSAFKEELLQQQIFCNGLEAALAAAAGEREKAQLSLIEYQQGLYPEEQKAVENELFAAEQRLKRATHQLEAVQSGTKSEENPADDVDTLRFEVEMAKRDVEGAKTRLSVLDTLTKPLRLKQLEGAVQSAEAAARAKETELSLHRERLAKIEKQIADCTITAPVAGVVFYANAPGRTEDDEILIGEGVPVRRQQVILRIAQLDQLSVCTEVAESEIAQLQTGMPAVIHVDTMPDSVFDGHVSKIHPYPTQETRGTTATKKYEVHVAIDNPSGTLRPGLTAEVVLTLSELDRAIQVPKTSVFNENDAEYCLVRSGSRWKLRPVVAGPSDGKLTVIREGLQPGEKVAIHPLQHRRQASP